MCWVQDLSSGTATLGGAWHVAFPRLPPAFLLLKTEDPCIRCYVLWVTIQSVVICQQIDRHREDITSIFPTCIRTIWLPRPVRSRWIYVSSQLCQGWSLSSTTTVMVGCILTLPPLATHHSLCVTNRNRYSVSAETVAPIAWCIKSQTTTNVR